MAESQKKKVQQMRETVLTQQTVKLLIYEAFLDRKLKGVPRHLMPIVHDHYFNPQHDAFRPRNLWSLSNAFTSAFKKLTPVKQFEVTAKLGSFLAEVQNDLSQRPSSFALPAQMGRIIPFGEPGQLMTIGNNPASIGQGNEADNNSEVVEINSAVEPGFEDKETVENYPWGDANNYYDEETETNELEKLEEEMNAEFITKAM